MDDQGNSNPSEPQVTYGETPGYPINARTGEPLDLTPEQRDEAAKNKIEQHGSPNDSSDSEDSPDLADAENPTDRLVTEGAVPGSSVANPGGLPPEVTRTSVDPSSGRVLVDGAGNPMGVSPRD
jgi:hypothetical protein